MQAVVFVSETVDAQSPRLLHLAQFVHCVTSVVLAQSMSFTPQPQSHVPSSYESEVQVHPVGGGGRGTHAVVFVGFTITEQATVPHGVHWVHCVMSVVLAQSMSCAPQPQSHVPSAYAVASQAQPAGGGGRGLHVVVSAGVTIAAQVPVPQLSQYWHCVTSVVLAQSVSWAPQPQSQ
jgi:hypothetical protein